MSVFDPLPTLVGRYDGPANRRGTINRAAFPDCILQLLSGDPLGCNPQHQ
jgi:hypothetical protein